MPGLIAFVSIFAHFLFSPDTSFPKKEGCSRIEYESDFHHYKKFLISGVDNTHIKKTFQLWDKYVFGKEAFGVKSDQETTVADDDQISSTLKKLDDLPSSNEEKNSLAAASGPLEIVATSVMLPAASAIDTVPSSGPVTANPADVNETPESDPAIQEKVANMEPVNKKVQKGSKQGHGRGKGAAIQHTDTLLDINNPPHGRSSCVGGTVHRGHSGAASVVVVAGDVTEEEAESDA
uniref:Uncharacterized protein n=2 Tax=Moniliophthora roreri TaxID=221103 RepID=A0A0W0GC21_MONRR